MGCGFLASALRIYLARKKLLAISLLLRAGYGLLFLLMSSVAVFLG